MNHDSAHFWKLVKYVAVGVGALMIAGIVTLMFLARGTGEDITGIVAPALLVTIISIVAAIMAFVLQRREKKMLGEKPVQDATV